MKVSELNYDHLGDEVFIEEEDYYINGSLDSVHHYREYVDESTLCDADTTRIYGPTTTTLIVSGWERSIHNSDEISVEFR